MIISATVLSGDALLKQCGILGKNPHCLSTYLKYSILEASIYPSFFIIH
jgi:hypothetical protein